MQGGINAEINDHFLDGWNFQSCPSFKGELSALRDEGFCLRWIYRTSFAGILIERSEKLASLGSRTVVLVNFVLDHAGLLCRIQPAWLHAEFVHGGCAEAVREHGQQIAGELFQAAIRQ